MNLRELVVGLDDPQRSWQVQMALIQWGEEAVEPLVEFLLGPPTLDPYPRCLAAMALGAIGGEKALEGLIKALSINDVAGSSLQIQLAEEAVRNCAAEQLGRLGDRRAVGPLLEALERSHLLGTARTLAAFGEVRAIPPMIDCLEDPFIRERVAEVLLSFGPQAVDPLIETLRVRRMLQGEETRLSIERRAEAARLLGELQDRRAVRPLISPLDDDADAIRLEAALALVNLVHDERIEKALTTILLALGTRDLLIQSRCLEALCLTGAKAVPLLIEAPRTKAIRTWDGQVLPVSDEAQLLMIESLVRIGDWRAVEVIGPLASEASRKIKWKAIKALGRLGHPKGVPYLLHALKDRDPNVRALAAEALGLIGSQEAVDALILAAGDRDERVARKAAEALTRYGEKALRPVQAALKRSCCLSPQGIRRRRRLEKMLEKLLEMLEG